MATEPRRGNPPPDAPDRRRRLHIHGITEMPASYDAEVAELFRDLRAASNMSEADLAATLSTRVEVVQALEQGALFALPPWTETCRVVAGYGTLLNLDVRPLLRRIYAQIEAGIVELRPKSMPDLPVMPQTQDADFEFPETGAILPQGAPQPPEPPAWPEPPPLSPDRRAEPRQGGSRPNQPPPPQPNQAYPPQRSQPGQAPRPPQPFPQGQHPQQPYPAQQQRPQPSPSPYAQQQPSLGQQDFRQQQPHQPRPPAAQPQAYGNAARQSPVAASVANGRDMTAPAKSEEKAPRRGLLKWGIVALVVSAAVFGLWLFLGDSSEPPRPKSGDQAPQSTDPDDPRSRKADRLPSPF